MRNMTAYLGLPFSASCAARVGVMGLLAIVQVGGASNGKNDFPLDLNNKSVDSSILQIVYTIASMTAEDAGRYDCVAVNSKGNTRSTAYVRVVGKKAAFRYRQWGPCACTIVHTILPTSPVTL